MPFASPEPSAPGCASQRALRAVPRGQTRLLAYCVAHGVGPRKLVCTGVGLAILIVYVVLTICMTWPLVLRLNTHFAGQDNDVWHNPWVTWWTEKAISEGRSLYYTDLMFHPHGVSLAFHSFSHVNTVLEILFRPWLGRLGAYNGTIILAHALSGYGMYCLARYVFGARCVTCSRRGAVRRPTPVQTSLPRKRVCTRGTARRTRLAAPRSGLAHGVGLGAGLGDVSEVYAAFFAGLVFAFFPYRMNESVHPVIVSTQWIPLYLLFVLRLLKEGRKRFILPAALFFLLTALSSWHLMTFTVFLSLMYVGYALIFERGHWSRSRTYSLILLAAVIGILLAPFLYPLIREQAHCVGPTVAPSRRSYVGVDLEGGLGNDLLAFALPMKEHPIWGDLVEPLHRRIRSTHRPVYIGITVVGLSLAAILADWRRARFWVLLALASALLSVGPYLQVYGRRVTLGCERGLIAHDILVPWSVPVVWLLRHPFRFSVLLGFALAMTSGLGLHWLATRRAEWRAHCVGPPLFAGAAMVLLLLEYLYLPFPTTPAVVPDFYRSLAEQPGKGAILELPMGRQPSKVYMYYQIVHGRPLVEGVVSRTPPEAYALIERTPALRSMQACGRWNLPAADLGSVLDVLAEHDIEYVILHKDWMAPSSVDTWMKVRTLIPDYEDWQIAVYRGPFGVPRLSAPRSGLAFGVGLHGAGEAERGPALLESCVAVRPMIAGPVSVSPGETLDVPLEWLAGDPPYREYVLELALKRVGPQLTAKPTEWGRREVAQQRQYEVTPGLPMTAWEMRARHQVTYSFPVDSSLPQDAYRLWATLVPVEGGSPSDRESLLSAHLLDIQVSASSSNADPP